MVDPIAIQPYESLAIDHCALRVPPLPWAGGPAGKVPAPEAGMGGATGQIAVRFRSGAAAVPEGRSANAKVMRE